MYVEYTYIYASHRGPVRPVGTYFPDNDRRSIHYPLHTFLNIYKYIFKKKKAEEKQYKQYE